MAEIQEVKSKRDVIGERLKKKYPDREFADDEALFGQISDDYDQYEDSLKKKTDAENKLVDTFSQYPYSARFISDMANGVNPWVAMIEQLGMDGITDIFENPEYKDELAKAQERYIDRMSEEKNLAEDYEKNLSESLSMIDAYQKETGVADEKIDAAVDLLMSIANDAIVGKFSRESMEMALKAINHDSDIEAARMEGEIGGRNAKIEEKLRKPKDGDGVPMLAGSNNAPSRRAGRKSIFEIAEGAR